MNSFMKIVIIDILLFGSLYIYFVGAASWPWLPWREDFFLRDVAAQARTAHKNTFVEKSDLSELPSGCWMHSKFGLLLCD